MREKRELTINQGKVLLDYFARILSKGNTYGITEDMYFMAINEIVEKINESYLLFTNRVRIEDDSFEEIVEEANKLNRSCKSKGIKLNTLNNGKLIAIPTYDLKKIQLSGPIIGYNGEDSVLGTVLNERIPSIQLSNYELSSAKIEDLEIAKKVSAFYINNLINRYVKDKIKNGYWPGQCRDIDEFIFEKDLGKIIYAKGTKNAFTLAYLNAIKVVCEMLESRKPDETIQFTNSDFDRLAHANYLKFVLPSELSFLRNYKYSEYQTHNSRLDISIEGNEVRYKTNTCVFSDPYDDFSDEYKQTSGVVGEEPVLIMEKRIGKINGRS